MSRPYQVPLLPLPPAFVDEVERHDRAVAHAVKLAEAAMIAEEDFDAQRATGVWPPHVFTAAYAPARSSFMRLAFDLGYGGYAMREDLLDLVLDRMSVHLGSASPRFDAWFRAAYDRSRRRQHYRASGSLFAVAMAA